MTAPRHTLRSRRSRSPLWGASYGFLRPPRRHEEEQRRLLDRVRDDPEMRREYRASVVIQMIVVGVLCAALVVFVVQSLWVVRTLQSPQLAPLRWMLPATAALLAWLALRRFLRLVADFRHMKGD